MKRSEINKIIDYTIDKAEFFKIPLPPFAFYTLEDWKKVTSDEAEIVDNMLGWDITDFGSGDFFRTDRTSQAAAEERGPKAFML